MRRSAFIQACPSSPGGAAEVPPRDSQRYCSTLGERMTSHAGVVDGDTVFSFDTGDVLIVKNIADPDLLRDDLAIV